MTDNRTTEMREKLRERGVEYEPTRFSTLQTTFTANGVEWIVTENEATGELFVEPRHGLTPEQAIAATLGGEQELIDLAHNAWSMALCAMNGMPIPAEWGNAVEHGLRKHGINVDEELAGFEVIDE